MPDQGEIRPSEPAEPRSLLQRVKTALGFKDESSLREEIEEALREPADGSLDGQDFSAEERALLRNILDLREVRVVDVAIPRADIIAVDVDVTLSEALRVFRDAAHSRLPVYRGTLDDPVGMVHIRDVVNHLAAGLPPEGSGGGLDLSVIDVSAKLSQLGILRSVLFVPPSMPVLDLLVQMQANHIHMALVIDEFGGTDGLVSIEDLVEQVVGDIEDEHDENEDAVIPTEDGYVASARAALDDVRAGLGDALPIIVPADVANAVDTLGGLVITLAGRVPVRGDVVRGPGDVEFEVLDADPRRVKRVRIRRVPPPAPAETSRAEASEVVAGARPRS
jgi:CBS domain containing-hemolysin-like protein